MAGFVAQNYEHRAAREIQTGPPCYNPPYTTLLVPVGCCSQKTPTAATMFDRLTEIKSSLVFCYAKAYFT